MSAKPRWRVGVVDPIGASTARRIERLRSGGDPPTMESPHRTYVLTAPQHGYDGVGVTAPPIDAALVTTEYPFGTGDPRVLPWLHHAAGARAVLCLTSVVRRKLDPHEALLRGALCDVGIAGDELAAVQGVAIEDLRGALCDALDALPDRARDEGEGVRFTVDGAFEIRGRGTVLSGRVERGAVRVGDVFERIGGAIATPARVTVRGVEMFRRTQPAAPLNEDLVGLLVDGVTASEVVRGARLCTPGALTAVTRVVVRVRALPEASPDWSAPCRCIVRGGAVSAVLARGASDASDEVSLTLAWPTHCPPGERVLLVQGGAWIATGEVTA